MMPRGTGHGIAVRPCERQCCHSFTISKTARANRRGLKKGVTKTGNERDSPGTPFAPQYALVILPGLIF
jgi:hypothetical protein